MMDFIYIPAVVGIITLGIYKVFELYARRRERLLIVEKTDFVTPLSDKPIDIQIGSSGKFGAIRMGCLFAGLGIGMLTAFIITSQIQPTSLIKDVMGARELLSTVYGSCSLLFGGIGLIASFIIEKKYWKK